MNCFLCGAPMHKREALSVVWWCEPCEASQVYGMGSPLLWRPAAAVMTLVSGGAVEVPYTDHGEVHAPSPA